MLRLFSRRGSTRHGIEDRVHRRTQKSFRGRAYLQGPFQVAGLLVPHAARLPQQEPVREPHAGAPRGAGVRHSLDPFGFLHGCVWVSEDSRPADRAGRGSRGGRPRPGDADHARAGMETQTVPRLGRSGTGDVPMRLVVELEAAAPVIGYRTPEEVETEYYANQAVQAASL